MKGEQRTILAILSAIEQQGYQCALVGGLAVSVRARPRFTKDVDFAVAVETDAEAEGLIRALYARGYEVRQVLEHKPSGRLATVRLSTTRSKATDPDVDLLFASSGIEKEVVKASERVEIAEGLRVPVATRGHLIALKVLAYEERRGQDKDDILALFEKADPADLGEAKKALLLIAERGFERGKNLDEELDRFLSLSRQRKQGS